MDVTERNSATSSSGWSSNLSAMAKKRLITRKDPVDDVTAKAEK
jgi:hypothetical protein